MSLTVGALTKLNRISPVALLWANVAVSLLVGVAHTGFLLVVRAGKAPAHMDSEVGVTYVTIPAAVIVLITAIAALIKPSFRLPVLKFHSVVLVAGALAAVYFGVRVALFGVPSGTNFVWNPLMFAFAVAYPAYLMQRSFTRVEASVNSVAVQAPLWAIGISVLISAAVMWRMANVAT